jgi:hypothetical protein
MPKERLVLALNEIHSFSRFGMASASNIIPDLLLQQVKWNSFRHMNLPLRTTSLSLGFAAFDVTQRYIKEGKFPSVSSVSFSTGSTLF